MGFKKKIKEIESLLQSDWKPLGDDVPEDEYRSYALKICSHLERGATVEDIKNLLLSFEQEDMELTGDEMHAQKVAQKLFQVWKHDYIYLHITLSDTEKKTKNIAQKYLEKLLKTLLPRQNPDFDDKIDTVKTWLLEFEEKNTPPIREIGLDKNGKSIIRMPQGNNYGYWSDNTLMYDDFIKKFKTKVIQKTDFERYWDTFST